MSNEKSNIDNKIAQRLYSLRSDASLSQAAFAAKIGIKQSTYNEIENEKREPSEPIIAAVCYRFPINEIWLRTGKGERYLKRKEAHVEIEASGDIKEGTAEEPQFKREVIPGGVAAGFESEGLLPLNAEEVVVMQVYVTGGAGSPYEFIPSEPIEEIVIPRSFYKKSIIPVKVRGRSMERTLRDGAVVGVDRSDRQIVNGELFAVWLPYQGTVIKRLYLNSKRIQLRSDNEEFHSEDIEVALDEVDDNFVQGRVKWALQLL
jgi:phage repressor protein C with HTH and peptisase S24 domain